MIKEYLNDRVRIIEKEIDVLQEKKRMCQITIKQINAQIYEVQNESDETSKMLSVSVRDNLAAKDQEVKDMKKHISQYFEEIDKYKKEIEDKNNEIELIRLCQKENEDLIVSRETSEATTRISENTNITPSDSSEEKAGSKLDITSKNFDEDEYARNKKIKEKLEFCKKICLVDGQRASMELENLLKEF